MANRAILTYNGTKFEEEIALLLRYHFPDAFIMRDVWAYSPNIEKSTQNDIIMVTHKGLYFIEAKNWRDWVFGNYNDKFWKGKASSTNIMEVRNIVKQSMIHIRAIRNGMRRRGVNPVYGNNLIVFPNSTELKTDAKEVININSLISRIKSYERVSTDSINIDEYRVVIENLSEYARYRRGEERYHEN